MESKNQTVKGISDLAKVAAEAQQGRMKLFNSTDLAGIAHTPENIATAIHTVKTITAQARMLVEMATVQRGMYLCWLKSNYTRHGEWEKFCAEHFPDISKRTRQFWMASYLHATGEKKPKELPTYEPDEMEDRELASAIESLNSSADTAPRRALLEHLKKLQKQIETGRDAAQKKNDEIELLRQQLEAAVAGASCVPSSIKDAAQVADKIRDAYWKLVKDWQSAMPADDDGQRVHLSLFEELKDAMIRLWETNLGPQADANAKKAERKAR